MELQNRLSLLQKTSLEEDLPLSVPEKASDPAVRAAADFVMVNFLNCESVGHFIKDLCRVQQDDVHLLLVFDILCQVMYC